jgi:hypothetical protein
MSIAKYKIIKMNMAAIIISTGKGLMDARPSLLWPHSKRCQLTVLAHVSCRFYDSRRQKEP